MYVNKARAEQLRVVNELNIKLASMKLEAAKRRRRQAKSRCFRELFVSLQANRWTRTYVSFFFFFFFFSLSLSCSLAWWLTSVVVVVFACCQRELRAGLVGQPAKTAAKATAVSPATKPLV
jgi:hypothetical protein